MTVAAESSGIRNDFTEPTTERLMEPWGPRASFADIASIGWRPAAVRLALLARQSPVLETAHDTMGKLMAPTLARRTDSSVEHVLQHTDLVSVCSLEKCPALRSVLECKLCY